MSIQYMQEIIIFDTKYSNIFKKYGIKYQSKFKMSITNTSRTGYIFVLDKDTKIKILESLQDIMSQCPSITPYHQIDFTNDIQIC